MKFTKGKIVSTILICLLIALMASTCVMASSDSYNSVCDVDTISNETKNKLDNYFCEAASSYNIPGASVVVVNKSRLLYAGNYGECKELSEHFLIGGGSKSFTALAIMKLVEQGKLDLNASVNTYLPEKGLDDIIKVIDLLHHTSGFSGFQKQNEAKATSEYGKFEYSNVNYDLLGEVIQNVSGKTYAQFIKDEILVPNKMYDTTGDLAKYSSLKFAIGHQNILGSSFETSICYPLENDWFNVPSGYIASTPEDIVKYLQLYLRGGRNEKGKRIISQKTIDSMFSNMVFVSDNQDDGCYGLGWQFENVGGKRAYYSNGNNDNYSFNMCIFPDEDIAIAVFSNSSDELVGNEFWDDVPYDLERILNGGEPNPVKGTLYFAKHMIIDIFYIALFLTSVVLLFFSLISKCDYKSVLNWMALIIGGIVLPIVILIIPSVFGSGFWVLAQYIRDMWVVLISSAGICFVSAIIRIIKTIISKVSK